MSLLLLYSLLVTMLRLLSCCQGVGHSNSASVTILLQCYYYHYYYYRTTTTTILQVSHSEGSFPLHLVSINIAVTVSHCHRHQADIDIGKVLSKKYDTSRREEGAERCHHSDHKLGNIKPYICNFCSPVRIEASKITPTC